MFELNKSTYNFVKKLYTIMDVVQEMLAAPANIHCLFLELQKS